MKLTGVIGITTRNMHVKFEAVRRSYNFWRKNAYSAGPSKQDEVLTFLNVLKNSWNLQNLLEAPPETCMWNLRQFGEVTIFDGKMPTAPDLQNTMKFWHFLNVLKNSWKLQNSLESPPETCMWNLRQFGEVTIFDGKMPTALDLQNRMKLWHFPNVLQNSWNLQNLLASPPETCLWNLRQFGDVTIFEGKMPTAPDLQNRIKFWHSLNVLQNSWHLQNLLESPPETCMWNLRQFGEVTIFDGKMPTAPNLQNRTKFWHFLNVLKNSWNLQNLLESTPETCMWNLRQFGEVTIFDRKMPTALDLQNRMKFWHSLNFLQNSWNLQELLESPPETCMWNLRQFGEVTIFDGKMPTAPDLQNRMKFWHFLNLLQNSWNLQNLLKSPPETCMWNLRQFGEVTIFDRKCQLRRTLDTGWNFDFFSMFSKIHETYRSYWNHPKKHACEIWGSSEKLQFLTEKCLQLRTFKTGWSFDFSQCSPKFMKFTEFIGITTRNMHVKFEAVRRSYNFWQKNAYSAGPSKQDEILTFSQCSPKFMKLTGVIGITTRNMHVKFEAVRRSYNFWRKNAYSAGPSKQDEVLTFLNVLKNSWNLQNLLESPPETCMWNLRQFGEVTIFDGKMPTAPNLQNRMKFWHSLNVLQNSWNLQNLLESPPETCMWNLRQFGEVTIFDGKMPTEPTFKTGLNLDIFSMFSKIHETYRSNWNHHQKHACEIWGS